MRFPAAPALAVALTVLVAVTWAADHDPVDGTPPAGDVAPIGVVEGQPVTAYLAASRAELAALARARTTEPTWALVSLDVYVAPDGLARLLDGVEVAQAYARAPVPIGPTQVIRMPVRRLPADAFAGMRAAATRRDEEQAGLRRFGAALTGGDAGQVRLRQAYEAAARTAAAEAAAYRASCPCLFAAVVRAAPGVLVRLGGLDGVRSVDPAPEVRSLEHTEFRPPLPGRPGAPASPPRSAAVPVPSTRPAVALPPGRAVAVSPVAAAVVPMLATTLAPESAT